jgi:hypothetical protein
MVDNGDIVVTGGLTLAATSVYSASMKGWLKGPDMNIPRGYQSSATLSNGKVLFDPKVMHFLDINDDVDLGSRKAENAFNSLLKRC